MVELFFWLLAQLGGAVRPSTCDCQSFSSLGTTAIISLPINYRGLGTGRMFSTTTELRKRSSSSSRLVRSIKNAFPWPDKSISLDHFGWTTRTHNTIWWWRGIRRAINLRGDRECGILGTMDGRVHFTCVLLIWYFILLMVLLLQLEWNATTSTNVLCRLLLIPFLFW